MAINNVKHINKSMLEQGLVFKKQGQKLAGHTSKELCVLHDNSETFNKKRDDRFGVLPKKPRNSLYFGDLFRSLMKKGSHYITYLNSEIVGKKKSEIILPDDVQCVVKEMGHKDMPYFNEVTGSRLANLMQIDTVYNVAYEDEDSFKKQRAKQYGWGDYTEYKYLFSVNCLAEGESLYSFEDLGMNFNDLNDITTILQQMEQGYLNLCKMKNKSPSEQDIGSLKTEMVKHYLFRVMFCEDGDWSAKNMSLIVTRDGEIKMGPGFDYEYLSKGRNARTFFRQMAMKNLSLIKSKHPKVFNTFLHRCEEVVASGELDDVVHNSLKVKADNKNNVHNIYERLVANVEMIRDVSNEIDRTTKEQKSIGIQSR